MPLMARNNIRKGQCLTMRLAPRASRLIRVKFSHFSPMRPGGALTCSSRPWAGTRRMSLIALIAWIITAGLGLYLLSIWLIEYDKDFHTVATTRLPMPVLTGHVMAGGGGLLVWAGYLIWSSFRLAWIALAALGLAATLGLVMAVRWVGVYRAGRRIARARHLAPAAYLGPPERNFPLPVVIAHGAFAIATLTLALLTAFGVGGS